MRDDAEPRPACPHCGEPVDLYFDPGGLESQEYVEDCAICCRPMLVRARRRGSTERFDVVVLREI